MFVDQEGPDPNFSATTAVADGRATVTVTGEVDMSTADTMRRAALPDDVSAAVLDLRRVTFFDSAAIHAVLQLAEVYGGALTVFPSAQVRRVLEISGLAGQPWLSD